MKYFTALVNCTKSDGTHHFTSIKFLAKRSRFSKADPWKYKILVGYGMSLEDVNNKPVTFFSPFDWASAVGFTFSKFLCMGSDCVLEHLQEIDF